MPGPCAAVAAVSVSGLNSAEFTFVGFLPRSGRSRRAKAAELAVATRAAVLYEAPHRLVATLGELVAAGAGGRSCVVGREMTKRHEESFRGTVAQAEEHFAAAAARDGRVRGEITLVLGPMDEAGVSAQANAAQADAAGRATALLCAELDAGASVSRAAKAVAAATGLPKARVYAEGLRLQAERREAESRGGAGSGGDAGR